MVFKTVPEQSSTVSLIYLIQLISSLEEVWTEMDQILKRKSWEKIWCMSDPCHVQQQQLLNK